MPWPDNIIVLGSARLEEMYDPTLVALPMLFATQREAIEPPWS